MPVLLLDLAEPGEKTCSAVSCRDQVLRWMGRGCERSVVRPFRGYRCDLSLQQPGLHVADFLSRIGCPSHPGLSAPEDFNGLRRSGPHRFVAFFLPKWTPLV